MSVVERPFRGVRTLLDGHCPQWFWMEDYHPKRSRTLNCDKVECENVRIRSLRHGIGSPRRLQKLGVNTRPHARISELVTLINLESRKISTWNGSGHNSWNKASRGGTQLTKEPLATTWLKVIALPSPQDQRRRRSNETPFQPGQGLNQDLRLGRDTSEKRFAAKNHKNPVAIQASSSERISTVGWEMRTRTTGCVARVSRGILGELQHQTPTRSCEAAVAVLRDTEVGITVSESGEGDGAPTRFLED